MEHMEQKTARRSFSIMLLSIFVYVVIFQFLVGFVAGLIDALAPQLSDTFTYVFEYLSAILIALPVALLIMRKVPARQPERESLSFGKFLKLFAISVAIMCVGNIVGNILITFLQMLFGIEAMNPLETITTAPTPFILCYVVIIGPLVEEFIFRKQMINRLGVYGEKTAVIISALAFGLFHGNISQFFYAFGLGLIWGYIYIRTGKLRYSAILHMLINFFNSFVLLKLLEKVDLEAFMNVDPENTEAMLELMTPSFIMLVWYYIAYFAIVITGVILLLTSLKKIRFNETELEIAKGERFRTSCVNVGMLLLLLASLACTVICFIPF